MNTVNPDTAYSAVYAAIARERDRQDAKWGEQNHPDGTGKDWLPLSDPGASATEVADTFRRVTEVAAQRGKLTWRHILLEEIAEALAETDPVKLRAELVQVAAVAVAWVEAIDRRAAPLTPRERELRAEDDAWRQLGGAS